MVIIMEVGRQQRASQIQPNYGRHQFVPQLVAESMIGEQENTRSLKVVKLSPLSIKLMRGKGY